jgi:5-methylcytosine-specific restriction enzyme A
MRVGWHKDETILALNLYYIIGRNVNKSNPDIIELSELLTDRLTALYPGGDYKRTASAVVFRFGNLTAAGADPNHNGLGMTSCSHLDREVVQEYINDKEKLKLDAKRIRIRICKLFTNSFYDGAEEGSEKLILHKYRERSRSLVDAKKSQVIQSKGKLECEVCAFNFSSTYGNLGDGFIEVHHKIPLSEYDGSQITHLQDLAVVCSNCHRMLHRSQGSSIESLKEILRDR